MGESCLPFVSVMGCFELALVTLELRGRPVSKESNSYLVTGVAEREERAGARVVWPAVRCGACPRMAAVAVAATLVLRPLRFVMLDTVFLLFLVIFVTVSPT